MPDEDHLPTLSGSRVTLRRLVPSDAAAVFEVFSDSDVTRYWSTPAFTDPSQAVSLIQDVQRASAEGSLLQWGLALGEAQPVIGTCTLAGIDRQNRRAELGYALGSRHWRNGYMAEALSMLLDYAFEDLALHRLEADVDPRNAASIRSLERLGFQKEGYLRERWFVAGEICDTVYFGLLAKEWQTQDD